MPIGSSIPDGKSGLASKLLIRFCMASNSLKGFHRISVFIFVLGRPALFLVAVTAPAPLPAVALKAPEAPSAPPQKNESLPQSMG